MIKATSGQTEARRIQVQSMFDPALPPLLVKRGRLQTFWGNLFAYAQRAVNEGGSITVTAEYDREHREATLTATFASEMLGALDNVYEASLRRAIEDQDGAFDRTQSDGTVSITAILPDKVAQALNEWIPGYEAFSERSKQVLRLIKSGAPIPSEEVFLAGILEEELERWLLPLLEQPLAVNLAHNLLDGNERRKKALTQIRKGKVKKEIAGPAYAAEILAAYNADDRHRSAVGAQSLGKDGVDRLSKMLGQPTPDYTECLRTIAKCK